MPLVSVPFERIRDDIVGPLVQSSSRHRFLWVLVNYATQYPKAIPLCNIRVDTVARELAQVFTSTGIPKQVVTNEGTSFMNKVFQAVCWFHGVQPMWTSIYHPQTNKLVEHFNRTLK